MRWYLRYGLSYPDVEELLAERGVEVDHVTVYRWVRPLAHQDHARVLPATSDIWLHLAASHGTQPHLDAATGRPPETATAPGIRGLYALVAGVGFEPT